MRRRDVRAPRWSWLRAPEGRPSPLGATDSNDALAVRPAREEHTQQRGPWPTVWPHATFGNESNPPPGQVGHLHRWSDRRPGAQAEMIDGAPESRLGWRILDALQTPRPKRITGERRLFLNIRLSCLKRAPRVLTRRPSIPGAIAPP